MKPLRRKTTIRGYSMGPLDLKTICDVCNKPRSFGNNTYKHTNCSKIRQQHRAEERAAAGDKP